MPLFRKHADAKVVNGIYTGFVMCGLAMWMCVYLNINVQFGIGHCNCLVSDILSVQKLQCCVELQGLIDKKHWVE